MATVETDRTRIVRDMVDAYNARDVDRMLGYFTDDAVIVSADGRILDEGRPALRDTFAEIFATNPELHADVPTWIEVGDWVCIHSIVEDWIHSDGSHAREEWVELYQVINGKITRLQLFS